MLHYLTQNTGQWPVVCGVARPPTPFFFKRRLTLAVVQYVGSWPVCKDFSKYNLDHRRNLVPQFVQNNGFNFIWA